MTSFQEGIVVVNKVRYSGGCRCGRISYKISGEPTWKVSCHCNWCQTSSGSAFRTFLLFEEHEISFSGNTLKSYEDTKTEHGRPMINQFCVNCGTIIGIKVPDMEQRHISIGTLDQRAEVTTHDNIWGQEALKFVSFSDEGDLYKTGYWNGTGEKMKKPR